MKAMRNSIYDYDWADSSIESIHIEYDKVDMMVSLDETFEPGVPVTKNVKIICNDVVGITDLCMWDDTDVFSVKLNEVTDSGNTFLSKIYRAYGMERSSPTYKPLKEHLLDFAIELSNQITFHVYCYQVTVLEQ